MERAILYRQQPYLKKTIWGGELLAKRYGGKDWGEAYLLSSLEKKSSVIRQNMDFSSYWRQHSNEEYPYLVKYIDVKTCLSVQVHPGRTLCKKGKNELWFIDKVRPGGRIFRGLRSGVTSKQLTCSADKDFLSFLQSEKVAVGDVVFIPGGMIHGAEGISFYEIQDPLDITYRLFDYGRGRMLQREEGSKALKHFPDGFSSYHGFSLRRQVFTGDFCMELAPYSFLLFLDGDGMLDGEESHRFSAGDCFFADTGGSIVVYGQGTLVYGTI